MPIISRNARVGSAYRDQVHRKTLPGEVTGLMTQPQRTRFGSSYMWVAMLLVGTLGAAICLYKFRVVMAAWSAIASSALGTMLFAIALTVGVCGSIASAVIWWVIQRELRASRNQREAMREYLAVQGAQGSEPERRQAA